MTAYHLNQTIGDFKQYAGKTILNNVYMDLRGKKPVFKRTKTAMERNNIFATIRRYAKKLKPQYNGDVYLETVRCYFDISQENLEKCRYTYQGSFMNVLIRKMMYQNTQTGNAQHQNVLFIIDIYIILMRAF